MDQTQYTSLRDVLAAIPDPRKARGQRYAWTLLLTLLAAGLASGQQSAHAIAQWVALHADELRTALGLITRLPSESTLLRALRLTDIARLEAAVAHLTAPATRQEARATELAPSGGTRLHAQALDGKALRDATACGAPTHLVSLVEHHSGFTLAQAAVACKRNEISAAPALLRGRDLTDTVITMDALLTQRKLAQQIIDQGGYYLMIVKANHPGLRDDLSLFFDLPAIAADHEHWDRITTVSKGHGRIETRTVECTTGACAALDWPGATSIVRRTCQRQICKTGKTTVTCTHALTNLPVAETSAAVLARLWLGHWTIESGSHYIRDVMLGEDHNHMHTGHAPQVLAALRNGLLALWRRAGWKSIADAVRATAASATAALKLIGVSTLT
jgi:predicted transposase YbfD/YdcC